MFRWLDRFVAEQTWLDRIGDPLQQELNKLLSGTVGKPTENILNGTWLGHPLHPVLSDVPVGSWTATAVLDALGVARDDDSLEDAADITLALGLAAGLVTAITGVTQWNDTYGKDRKVGLLHGLMMLATVGTYAGALAARRTGARPLGIALSNTGYLLLAAGSYLGGDEAYDLGYGVNHTAWISGPTDYVQVMRESDLELDKLTKGDAQGTAILLVKRANGIFALDDTCTHAGCSLSGGTLEEMSVICPCHGSQFSLLDGEIINGPATYREPSYHVRIRDGMVEVKRAE